MRISVKTNTIELNLFFSVCEEFNAGNVNNSIEKWIKDIDKLNTELTGSDSFLSTAQSQIDTLIASPGQATSFLDQQIANLTAAQLSRLRRV